MTINDYAISQELGNVVLKLLAVSNFLEYIKNIESINLTLNEDNEKETLFQIFENPLLWAAAVHNYGLKNNCKTELDKMLTIHNFKKSDVNTVIELSSNFFVELCCPTTKK